MDYEKKYKEALKRATKAKNNASLSNGTLRVLGIIFPELKESEDERIRKSLIILLQHFCKGYRVPGLNFPVSYKDMLAWLEKQGEQKVPVDDFKAKDWYVSKVDGKIRNIYYSVDKTEPKFKEGDWIINNDIYGDVPVKIKEIGDYLYLCERQDGVIIELNKNAVLNEFKHWDITDANDGDVLVNGSNIFIFHFLNDTRLMGYCHINTDDEKFYYDLGKNECFCLIDAVVTPATKEQCNLLFAKMKEFGYEWDAEKKELKKIEQKSAWSEEDERNLQGIIDEIEASKNFAPESDLVTYDRYLSWLKSLRTKNTWKPSEEQMDALETAVSSLQSNTLETLFQDLKREKNYE